MKSQGSIQNLGGSTSVPETAQSPARKNDAEARTCTHPDFVRCSIGAYPYTFVFGRNQYNEPSAEAVEKYQADKAIVEAHGGRMCLLDFEIGGETQVFTSADVEEAKAAVLRDNPDLIFVELWNGVGCRSLSIGCRQTIPPAVATPQPVSSDVEPLDVPGGEK